MNFLHKKVSQKVKKIFYFSDGSTTQYKNRNNFAHLLRHEEDFGCRAEYFFSTSHGKGSCDGVGGALKKQRKQVSSDHSIIRSSVHMICICLQQNCKDFMWIIAHTRNIIHKNICYKTDWKILSLYPAPKNYIPLFLSTNLK